MKPWIVLATLLLARPTLADEVRACWLTQYAYLGQSESQLRAIAQNIRAGGMNTVYVAVYAGARTLWPSKAYLAAGGSWQSPSVDYADLLVDVFHDEGLAVGAWFEYGLAVGLSDHPLAVAHPDWLARDQGGDPVTGENGGFVFLSPGHPDATAMIVEMVRELAANYDFDDIQVDRIRWGRKTTGREYGYEAATAGLYQSTYGVAPPTDVNDPHWVQFREGLVNDVVARCYDAVKQTHPGIVVSSAPTGSYGITQHMQRWSDWVEGGYMDLVMPQMYLTSLSAFQNELQTQLAQAPAHKDRIGVGYRASEDNDWSLVASQLQYADTQGVPHGCLWVYHQYTSQIAIQDEIDNLSQPGQEWGVSADNPFVDEDTIQLIVDDDDGAPAYTESGAGFIASSDPTSFRLRRPARRRWIPGDRVVPRRRPEGRTVPRVRLVRVGGEQQRRDRGHRRSRRRRDRHAGRSADRRRAMGRGRHVPLRGVDLRDAARPRLDRRRGTVRVHVGGRDQAGPRTAAGGARPAQRGQDDRPLRHVHARPAAHRVAPFGGRVGRSGSPHRRLQR